MTLIKATSFIISIAMLTGCASTGPKGGANGPRLVGSGRSTPSGAHYAEVGVEFSTGGDFVALFAPTRWKKPTQTGGSLSWMNPAAWNEDAGRTGRVLLGEAVVVGVVVAAALASGSGGDDGGGPTPPPDPVPPDPPPTPE
ncbi:hypothetical protein PDESU_00650 [Pontiella desulfatans]|uniref:Uncharacterized protein n=1 Tax=Pontiella desulfatans TaxID=2750659 RepID=A0A6C2TWP2_PONDE|nr:hypothetical protein [Pontiella desulfatans]VGO12100.1 hypothetical protein PDESU_00650 [Pontiella desulfatans]